jgi:cell division protein FtsB
MNIRVKKTLHFLYNKYVLILLLFVVWIGFVDDNSIVEHIAMRQNIRNMKQEKTRYEAVVVQNNARLQELKTSNENLEKFAREQYLMHAPNEDVFLVVE